MLDIDIGVIKHHALVTPAVVLQRVGYGQVGIQRKNHGGSARHFFTTPGRKHDDRRDLPATGAGKVYI